MLYYLPLESYKERYTEQWSAPVTGWLERRWIEHKIHYTRIDGTECVEQRPIKAGVVLDATRRCRFAMSQINQLLILLEQGKITDEDIIYMDDFWHPGMESLFYCFHLYDVHPKTFAFLHAQSVDEYDFTHEMLPWIRRYEQGNAMGLTGIFTSCPTLAKLIHKDGLLEGSICLPYKVHVTGHPFCSEEVRERMPRPRQDRLNHVVWSSRWDEEKNPGFFMQVAGDVLEQTENTKFFVCTGANKLRSNNPNLVRDAYLMQSEWPNRFTILEGLTKTQYYSVLANSKIQFNCAQQDFVAISLLEASVAGCYPIYPYFRSFPETFRYDHSFMYKHLDQKAAVEKIIDVLSHDDLWIPEALKDRAWIHERFDTSWQRMRNVMNGLSFDDPFYIPF